MSDIKDEILVEETEMETLESEVETDELEMELESDEAVDLADDSETEIDDVETEASLFLQEEEESEGFLPDAEDEDEMELSDDEDEVSVNGTELDEFDSVEIEDVEFVEEEQLESIIESVLFASDRPVSLASLKQLFKGTNIKSDMVRRALDQLAIEYAGGRRGVTLEEVPGGYQLRTKIDNMEFLKRTLKTRQFRLSGPALEVLSIVAYKQPLVKAEVDEIRGVESGHLLRALMEKNLVAFEGKSDLPGRPMQYGTTRKFLEIFGLRSLKELPTLSQIDEILPEGIDEEQAEEKLTLANLTDSLAEGEATSYSQGEEELLKIQAQLEDISTTTNFFEEEKRRQAEKKDQERAQAIRDALAFGDDVSTRDANWLQKYDEALAAGTTLVQIAAEKKAAFMKSKQNPSETTESEEMKASEVETEESAESDINTDAETEGSEDVEVEMSEDDSEMEMETGSDSDSDVEMEAVENEESEEFYEDEMDELERAIAEFDSSEDEEEESDDDELPFFGEADDIDEEGEASF